MTIETFVIHIGRIDRGGVWRDSVVVPPLGNEIRSHADMRRIQDAARKRELRALRAGGGVAVSLYPAEPVAYMHAPEREPAPDTVVLAPHARMDERRKRALLR